MSMPDAERGGSPYGDREDDESDAHRDDESLTNLLPMDDLSDDSSPPTPRFLQDQRTPIYMKWIPKPVLRVSKAAARWAKGPDPPRIYVITPWLPMVQEAPIRLLDRFVPKRRHRISLLVAFYFLWALVFAIVMYRGTAVTEIDGWGVPGNIGCGNTYWVPGNECGMNGNGCRPFSGSGFAFRCPGNCIDHQILNYRAVGAQEVIYRPLVIGGPSPEDETPVYRADSFICGAAIHAGIISNAEGGCGIVSLVGRQSNYNSSDRHGIKSIGFDSTFPSSFTFQAAECSAKDPRWKLLGVSLTFTIVLSLFTTSPAVFFFSIFTGVFFHVGLASDSPGHSSVADLMSNLIGKYLPAAFCAFVMYRYMGVRHTLTGLNAQIDKTVFWLGGCWFGALSNYTLEWIPIQRLNAHDLEQQPGAKLALALILIVLVVIIAGQVIAFRQEARLVRFLEIYGILVGAILVALIPPGLSLRIHHYILALLLISGTSLQTRPSLLYQGLLIGLFCNGIARWGFDSVLQTADELRGDAPTNSLLPVIPPPVISSSSIGFSWEMPLDPYDGVSVLVNDVERFRGYKDEGYPKEKQPSFVWSASEDSGKDDADAPVDHAEPTYFRFGYMQGSRSWDYTKAGTWNANGTWIEMKEGPSKIKRWEGENEARLTSSSPMP